MIFTKHIIRLILLFHNFDIAFFNFKIFLLVLNSFRILNGILYRLRGFLNFLLSFLAVFFHLNILNFWVLRVLSFHSWLFDNSSFLFFLNFEIPVMNSYLLLAVIFIINLWWFLLLFFWFIYWFHVVLFFFISTLNFNLWFFSITFNIPFFLFRSLRVVLFRLWDLLLINIILFATISLLFLILAFYLALQLTCLLNYLLNFRILIIQLVFLIRFTFGETFLDLIS